MPKSSDKYYPTENVTLDFRTSCTKEEAAAKLIGWMKGNVRHDYPSDIDEDEITSDNLVYTHSLIYGLQEHLQILRNAEWNRYNEAVCAKLPEEVLNQKAYAIAECDELIHKVGEYLCDIDEELEKEYELTGSSALKIDRRITEDSGTLHITIRSLDRWARQKYGISILDSDTPVSQTAKARPLDDNQRDGAIKYSEKGIELKPKDAKNLYLTFAFLIDAFAQTTTKFQSTADKSPNISAIANRIEELAKNGFGTEKHTGQSAESIKTRIENAMKIKKEYL